jgi:glycosyltransferase involved in cell wall biosynthesis
MSDVRLPIGRYQRRARAAQMTIVSETHLVGERSSARAAAAGETLFLLTHSQQPCGVEVFTRALATALAADDACCKMLSISGRWRDLPSMLRRVAQAERIVFSFPLVAWKRLLLMPIVLLLIAFVTGRRISTCLHEWSAMHPLRRLALLPFVWLSNSILVLSPLIREQLAADRRVAHAARKCCLIPHPPTVRRPDTLEVTERIRGVERAATGCDLVIGTFGAIYDGKASAELLEICAHLRSRGLRALVVFAGGFITSLDGYEGRFRARIAELEIESQVIVTGYIENVAELYALFEKIGVFLFLFPEGLTARRSSVIACLQSNRPVVVTAPQSPDEFRHHPAFGGLIDGGALSFVSASASVAEIAERLLAAAERKVTDRPVIDAEAWWKATTAATRDAL